MTAVAFGVKTSEQPLLDRQRRHADQAEDAVGHRALGRALDPVHPAVHLGQALAAVRDADGQREVDEAEAVAELAGQRLVERPQVERDHRADLVDERVAAAR